jgi:hypothetical protein
LSTNLVLILTDRISPEHLFKSYSQLTPIRIYCDLSKLSIVRPLPRCVELEPLHEWLRFSNADSVAFVLRKVPRCVNLILQRFSLSGSHEVRNRTHHARDPSNGPSIHIHQRSLIQRAESHSMRLQATFGHVPVGLPLGHRGGRGVKIERHVERV